MGMNILQDAAASIFREKRCNHLHIRRHIHKRTHLYIHCHGIPTRRVPSSMQLISHVLFDRLLPPSTTSSTWLSIHAHHTEINRLYHQFLFLSSRNKLRRDSDGQTLGPSWVKRRQRSEKRLKGSLSEIISTGLN